MAQHNLTYLIMINRSCFCFDSPFCYCQHPIYLSRWLDKLPIPSPFSWVAYFLTFSSRFKLQFDVGWGLAQWQEQREETQRGMGQCGDSGKVGRLESWRLVKWWWGGVLQMLLVKAAFSSPPPLLILISFSHYITYYYHGSRLSVASEAPRGCQILLLPICKK